MLSASRTRLLIFIVLICVLYLQIDRFTAHRSNQGPDIASSAELTDSIPKKIWQTAARCPSLSPHATSSTSPEETLKDDKHAVRIKSWIGKNPDWEHQCISDEDAEAWVRAHFNEQVSTGSKNVTVPVGRGDEKQKALRDAESIDWVGQLYLELKDPILKADLLRYLLLYIEGGLYTDLDTTCNLPISTWVANSTLLSHVQVIVGIESDRQPVENDWKLYSDYRKYIWGITNWTFASRPGHPFLRTVLSKVGTRLLELAEKQGKGLGELQVLYTDVIESTGPRVFSEAFLEYMTTAIGVKGYESFSMLEEARVLENTGVLVLPIRAYSLIEADRVDGDGARSLGVENVVRHWSEGGWKADHLIDDREGKKRPEGWEEVVRKEGIDEG